jgi:hypothetical protein
MSTLSFNCRGAGNAATVGEMRDLVRKFAPEVFCILETQIHKKRSEDLRRTLGYDQSFGVSSDGGGMCVFWNNSLHLKVVKFSCYHIDMIINGGGEPWRLTCWYGEATRSERHGR